MTEPSSQPEILSQNSEKSKKEIIFGVEEVPTNSFSYDEEKKIEEAAFYDKETKRKLFKCPYHDCKRIFKEKGNLRTHVRVHTGERPYVCHYKNCDKSFITMGNLKSHICNHTGEKPFECPHPRCGKKYSRLCRLKIHQRTHTGDKPFACDFAGCGKQFNEKGNLKTHYRIHTGEKPYVCNFTGCEQSFKAHGHLKDHMKRHYNIRPYECSICGARFARTSTLKIHSHTHTGEKPHPCPFPGCEKRFSEKGNMKTHYKTHRWETEGEENRLPDESTSKVSDSSNGKNEANFNLNSISNFKNLPMFFDQLRTQGINQPNLLQFQTKFEQIKSLYQNLNNQFAVQSQSFVSDARLGQMNPLPLNYLLNSLPNNNNLLCNTNYGLLFNYLANNNRGATIFNPLLNGNINNNISPYNIDLDMRAVNQLLGKGGK